MIKLKINIVDAFTERAFGGNSAAVIISETWLSAAMMQSIAIENNLSETAFVKIVSQDFFEIRWFSPLTEIDFCGHATLAAASVIFSEFDELGEITFYAKAVGELQVNRLDNGFIEMKFPNRIPQLIDKIPENLVNGLSIKPVEVLLNNQAYFVVYADQADVKSVIPDSNLLKKLSPYDVVVTAKSDEYDFISRYFWPANGGDEDPVTGSIHAGLAPYWAKALDKKQLRAFQASKRGGELRCRVTEEWIFVSGKTVHYLQGYISV